MSTTNKLTLTSVATVGLALMTTTALADIKLYGTKDGQCFRTTFHAKTGMNQTVNIGGRKTPIKVPESLRGNIKGAHIVYGGMSRVTVDLVSSGAADGAYLFMKCNGKDAGAWKDFCGKGLVKRSGITATFSDSKCKHIGSGLFSNDGPEKLYNKLKSIHGKASATQEKKHYKAAATATATATVSAGSSKGKTVVSSDEKVISGRKVRVQACPDRTGCLNFNLTLR